MKSTIIFQSSEGNLYLYDFRQKEIKPCHPIIYICSILDKNDNYNTLYEKLNNKRLTEYSNKDIEFYCHKYLYYRNIGYFSVSSKKKFVTYTSKDLIEVISNINNIVFEVTDICNLHCKYCAYGELYNDYDPRTNKKMSFETIKSVFKYLIPFWKSKTNKSAEQIVSIGFYGGEPLMNFSLIKQTVEYCNSMDLPTRKFQFTMTTNATLIDKHIEFLVKNKFNVTISLDGNQWGNSYRLYHNGTESFDKVFYNVKKIQEKYPDYFAQHISFNSVLHDRNSVESTHQFIYEQFGKIPEIHAINSSGIRVEKQKDFNKMFVSYNDSQESKDIMQTRLTSNANIFALCQFLLWYGNNQYFDYESFLYSPKFSDNSKTGTCFPFSRKMYITVNGKILPCEKINTIYALGKIVKDKVYLDLESIARKYNDYYSRMYTNCKECYMINGCTQCIFQLELMDTCPQCNGFCTERGIQNHIRSFIDLLESKNITIDRLLNEVFLS